MERKASNYAIKKEARRLYEEEGLSMPAIGKALGKHPNTIRGWRDAEGWGAKGSVTPTQSIVTPDADATETEATPADVEVAVEVTNVERELRAKVAELEAKAAGLEAQVEEFRPDVDITVMMFQNEDDLAEVFNDQYWLDRVQLQFADLNRQRRLQGLERLKFDEDEIEDEIRRAKQQELSSRQKPAWGPPDKRIKLVKKNPDGSFFPPHIVQLPYESQVNNVAGSLADGLVIYTRKGYKLTAPFLCPRRNCFKPALLDHNREWAHDGYCSAEHFIEVEKPVNPAVAKGVTVKDMVGGLAGR